MGRMIKSASKSTYKSILNFLNRVVTLIFGLYCIVSGQGKHLKDSFRELDQTDYGIPLVTKTINGKVTSSKDSSIIEGIKVIISRVDISFTLYGVGTVDTSYVKLDSTKTNSDGEYEVVIDSTENYSNFYCIEAIDIDSTENGQYYDKKVNVEFAYSQLISTEDTTINIAMSPKEVDINKNQIRKYDSIETIVQGKNVIINLEKLGNKNGLIKVVNAKGSIIDKYEFTGEKIIKWKTGDITRGIYYISIESEGKTFTSKVTIK